MKNILLTEVKLQINKIGIIQILNTILINVGDFRQLEETDDWEMIVNTAEYINSNYPFNMLHLVDWETCKGLRKFSSKQMRKRLNSISKITQLIYGVDNNYYMEVVVDYSDYNYWEKFIAQYPNCSLILDNYFYQEIHDDYFNNGKIPLNSVIMTNQACEISIQHVENNQYSDSVSPIHFGYVHLVKLYSDIILFNERLYNKISTEIYEAMFSAVQEYFNKEYQIWLDYKNNEVSGKTNIDSFSIFHTPNVDNKIVKSWQSFIGEYCPISECCTAQYKHLTYKEKKCKEVVLQPLWI